MSASQGARVAELRDRVARYSEAKIDASKLSAEDREARARLQALGYTSGSGGSTAGPRPDPKDRRAIAARLSEVTSGELSGPALENALRQVLAQDPNNPQANLRLGYVLLESSRCPAAMPFFARATAARMPSADAHLGLAMCQLEARRPERAEKTLREAMLVEPDNPVVLANLGMVLSNSGRHREGIELLRRALTIDPQFHEARFNLARVYARAGQRAEAAREAQELLSRLPAERRSERRWNGCSLPFGRSLLPTIARSSAVRCHTLQGHQSRSTLSAQRAAEAALARRDTELVARRPNGPASGEVCAWEIESLSKNVSNGLSIGSRSHTCPHRAKRGGDERNILRRGARALIP